ncbi:hypothetical protein KAR91_44765 [Candidatus Pacearchaeota archaeon]|nr:hypothetical protein [Candidatus Pacearchaeota archaeon]
MINFIYYEGENSASEEPYSRQHYMEWISDFKRHIIHSWDDVDPYTASSDKRNICFTAFVSNIGHHMDDEITAIQHLYNVGDMSNVDTLFIGDCDHFHIAQLFPSLPILNRHVSYSTKSIDVFKMALKDNLFGFRLFFDGPFQEELAQKIHRTSRGKCSQQFLELVKDSGKRYPLVWVTLRSHNRVWLSQKEGLANILNELCRDFPNLGVVFDGMPRETQLMNEIKALLDPGIAVFNGLNCSKEQTLVWAHQIDFFIAPYAAGTIFTTIANRTGITHTHSTFTRDAPYHVNRRENNVLVYPVQPVGDQSNEDQFICDYDVNWEDIYDMAIKLMKMTRDKQGCLV